MPCVFGGFQVLVGLGRERGAGMGGGDEGEGGDEGMRGREGKEGMRRGNNN